MTIKRSSSPVKICLIWFLLLLTFSAAASVRGAIFLISAGEGIGAKPSILMSSNEKPACCFTSFNFGVCINNHIKNRPKRLKCQASVIKNNYPCPIIRRRPQENSRGRLKVIYPVNGKSRGTQAIVRERPYAEQRASRRSA